MRSNDRCFTKNINENRLTDWYLFIARRLIYAGMEVWRWVKDGEAGVFLIHRWENDMV